MMALICLDSLFVNFKTKVITGRFRLKDCYQSLIIFVYNDVIMFHFMIYDKFEVTNRIEYHK